MTEIQVKTVSDLDAVRELEGAWRAVHAADPHATVFTSWEWIVGRLSALGGDWWVLTARDADGRMVGCLPLRTGRSSPDAESPALTFAGSPLADYTGFVCAAEREDEVLAALADHVRRRMSWDRLELRDVLDPRLDAFLGRLRAPELRLERRPPTPCPLLALEPSWELYLRERVGSQRRQTLRRQLRKIRRGTDLRFTSLADGGESQISILFDLWQSRWGGRESHEAEEYLAVFRSCHRSGLLWLDVAWDGDEPMAGLLAFLDRGRSRFCFYLSGFDERYAEWSPGTVMVARSIREAIRLGFRHYDFLRGDEQYKYSFGARREETENVDVARRKV